MKGNRSAFVEVEHPDRVVWYLALIEEWTHQVPAVASVAEEQGSMVAAWVGPYYSQAGVYHPAPTQVWAGDVEQALERLANVLYADLCQDCRETAVSSSWSSGERLVQVGQW